MKYKLKHKVMVTSLAQSVAAQITSVVSLIRGYEESGNIAVDSIALKTRDALKAHGVL